MSHSFPGAFCNVCKDVCNCRSCSGPISPYGAGGEQFVGVVTVDEATIAALQARLVRGVSTMPLTKKDPPLLR